MDKTLMIWKSEMTTGIWINEVTVGELSHCALGFFGGHWSANGDAILAHGYGGSFHLWKDVGVDSGDWKPQSGHFASVSDIAWSRGQGYVLSVCQDQTSRIFAPCFEKSFPEKEGSWHEIARPQVHGHDINCVTFIHGKENHHFVTGFFDELKVDVQILGANISALGLSQKSIYSQVSPESNSRNSNDGLDTLETVPESVPVDFTEPPIEEQLAWHTLWPESHKLYGHGNELYSLCCDHGGKLVASSCKECHNADWWCLYE